MGWQRIRAALGAEPPHALAALRIAVSLIVVLSPELRRASELAADRFALDVVPEGLGLVAKLGISPTAARVLELCAASSAATGLLGYWSRLSMALVTVCGGLAFSLSQRSGAVFHDMHLFWFSALLSVSRCGDVWALDAWGRKPSAPSLAYGAPTALARALLGLVYFFPGLHKLRQPGAGFTSASAMIQQMHAKWFEFGALPALRIDHFPELCRLGAWLVVAFELSFVVLVQLRRTRLLAAALGLAFHLGTGAFFFIHFPSLWVCYGILLPFGERQRQLALTAQGAARPGSRQSWPLAAVCVGCVLIVAESVQGARGKMQAWPFACYPTFAQAPGETLPDVSFEVTHASGQVESFTGRERQARSQFEWRRVFYLVGAPGARPPLAAFQDFAQKMAERAHVTLERGAHVRALRAEYATDPASWGRPPLRSATVLAWTVNR